MIDYKLFYYITNYFYKNKGIDINFHFEKECVVIRTLSKHRISMRIDYDLFEKLIKNNQTIIYLSDLYDAECIKLEMSSDDND